MIRKNFHKISREILQINGNDKVQVSYKDIEQLEHIVSHGSDKKFKLHAENISFEFKEIVKQYRSKQKVFVFCHNFYYKLRVLREDTFFLSF